MNKKCIMCILKNEKKCLVCVKNQLNREKYINNILLEEEYYKEKEEEFDKDYFRGGTKLNRVYNVRFTNNNNLIK